MTNISNAIHFIFSLFYLGSFNKVKNAGIFLILSKISYMISIILFHTHCAINEQAFCLFIKKNLTSRFCFIHRIFFDVSDNKSEVAEQVAEGVYTYYSNACSQLEAHWKITCSQILSMTTVFSVFFLQRILMDFQVCDTILYVSTHYNKWSSK